MHFQSSLAQRSGLLAIFALILLTLNGCASQYVWTCYGVTAHEGFNAPRRVLVDRKTGTVVIDADAFHFKPGEEKVFYNNRDRSQPLSARAARPVFRRFIVTDAENIARQIKYDIQRGQKWIHRQGEAPNEVEVWIYTVPSGPEFDPWRVVPEAFDAPPATDAQLAALLPGGFEEYPWGTRIPWVAGNGKTYQIKLELMDSSVRRFVRSPAAQAKLPILVPIAFVVDLVTFPVQGVGIFVLIAMYGI